MPRRQRSCKTSQAALSSQPGANLGVICCAPIMRRTSGSPACTHGKRCKNITAQQDKCLSRWDVTDVVLAAYPFYEETHSLRQRIEVLLVDQLTTAPTTRCPAPYCNLQTSTTPANTHTPHGWGDTPQRSYYRNAQLFACHVVAPRTCPAPT